MYHFMFGLRGGSATAATAPDPSGAVGAAASVLLVSLLASSGISLKILSVLLLREKVEQPVHARVNHIIDNEEIHAK